MGTRGVWGLRKNDHTIAVYHHFDSYPEGLGYSFTEFLKRNSNEKLSELYDNIVEIDANVKPTEEQKKYCEQMGWCNLGVSYRSTDDWYCLLREAQEPENWQSAVDSGKTVYVDNNYDFLEDTLFCEYGYIYDIDTEQLLVYGGRNNRLFCVITKSVIESNAVDDNVEFMVESFKETNHA